MGRQMDLVYFTLSWISQGITTIVIILHILLPKLRKYPGQYVLLQCLCQFVYDAHWVTAFLYITYTELTEKTCEILGMIESFIMNMGLIYTVALSIELLIKLKDISNIAYYKRNIFYHLSSILISFLMFILIFSFGSYGKSPLGTCSLNSFTGLIIQNILRITVLIILALIIFSLMHNIKKPFSRLMWNYCLIITFVWLTWCVPGVLILMNYIFGCEYCLIAATLLGTLSGTLVGLSRLVHKQIFRGLKKKFLSNLEKQDLYLKKRFIRANDSSLLTIHEGMLNNESIIRDGSSIYCFSDMFNSLLNKSKLEILSSMYLFFFHYTSDKSEDLNKKTRGYALQGYDLECLCNILEESEQEYLNTAGIVLLEYRSSYFSFIRKYLGYKSFDFIQSISEQLKLSYTKAKVIQNESNNSILIFTSDKKFVIKTISKEEKNIFFRFLLESYYKRVLECPKSKLVRILGIFKILPSKITFIIKENSNPFNEPCLIFDLKGSSIDRLVKTGMDYKSIVLKDENLVQMGKKVKLSSDEVCDLMWTIRDDMIILRDIGIMDYSLLLIAGKNMGVTNRYSISKDYTIAIIDIFQVYDTRKVLERWFKTCFRRADRNKLSAVSPAEYYRRILQFLQGIFTERDEYDLSGML